jgi:CRISPR-associated protein Cas6
VPVVDLLFPVVGTRVPTDHCYALFGALSRLLPCLHDGSVPFAMAPLTGQPAGQGLLGLDPARSHLRLRLPASDIGRVIPLAGKCLEVMGRRIRLGVPQVFPLRPASALFARTVTFKHATDAAPFLDAARRQLDSLGIGGSPEIPEHVAKDGRVELHRHVLRVKGSRIVCFPLLVRGLTTEGSLRLQEAGLGGRRRMGGGFFIPVRGREDARAP